MRFSVSMFALLSAVLFTTTAAAQQPTDTRQQPPASGSGWAAQANTQGEADPAAVIAPPEPAYARNITINPLAMIFTAFNVEIETRVSGAVSYFASPELLLVSDVTAFGLTQGFRFFMLGEANEGLWISPEVGLFYATGGGASAFGSTWGALLGYTAIWSHFVLSFGLGARYTDVKVDSGVGVSAVGLAARLSIGYAF